MQLDDQIRDVLAREAADVPEEAVIRLRRVAYKPRSHSLAPRLAGGVLAGAAAAAGLTAALAGGGATPRAFAGWSASPATDAPRAGAAESTCAERLLAGAKVGAPNKAKVGAPKAAKVEPATKANREPQVVDTRGPFTLVLYKHAICFAGPGFVGLHGVQSGAEGVAISTLWRLGSPYTIAAGPAPADASAATLSLEDGTSVMASVSNSLFAAWWPSDSRPTRVTITTPSGTSRQALSFPPPPALPPGKKQTSP